MESTVQKWGNSLGIRIPKVFAKEMDLIEGSSVNLIKDGDKIIIKPSKERILLEKINSINLDNLHNEISFGKIEGNEIW